MILEFSRFGNTYQHALAIAGPAPETVVIPFRRCPLKPPAELELRWVATDEVRGIELYRPVREL